MDSAFSTRGPRDRFGADQLHRELDVHGSLERVAVELAVALDRVAVADIQERTGLADGQIDGRALDDLVEVHVAADTPVVGRSHGRAGVAGRDADAAEHRTRRDGEIRKAVGGFRELREARLQIQAPDDVVPLLLVLGGPVGCDGAAHEAVVADGCAAVELQLLHADDEEVSRHRALDVERTGLGVATDGACLTLRVDAAGIDRPCAHGVAGPDAEHGLDRAREDAVELLRLEVQRARRHGLVRRGPSRPPGHGRSEAGGLAREAGRSRELPFLEAALELVERAPRILPLEADPIAVALDRARDRRRLAAAHGAGQLAAVDFHLHPVCERVAEEGDHQLPFAGEVRCGSGGKRGGDEKDQRHAGEGSERHAASCPHDTPPEDPRLRSARRDGARAAQVPQVNTGAGRRVDPASIVGQRDGADPVGRGSSQVDPRFAAVPGRQHAARRHRGLRHTGRGVEPAGLRCHRREIVDRAARVRRQAPRHPAVVGASHLPAREQLLAGPDIPAVRVDRIGRDGPDRTQHRRRDRSVHLSPRSRLT